MIYHLKAYCLGGHISNTDQFCIQSYIPNKVMIQSEQRQIKIEQREEQQPQEQKQCISRGFVKIQYDPVLYPPIKWAPINPLTITAETTSPKLSNTQSYNPRWVKLMKKNLIKQLSAFISQTEFNNFMNKFSKWKHSSAFIFLILMYVYHKIPHLKNNFCDSYQTKIQKLQHENCDENDLIYLGDSIRIVLEFFIGEPFNAFQEFYRKYRYQSSYDHLKAKKCMKIIEMNIVEDEGSKEVDCEFNSADIYQQPADGQQKQERMKNNYNRRVTSDDPSYQNGRSSEDHNRFQLMKTRSRSTVTNVFRIYRKDDKTKSVLYPIDPNYSIKNAFNDLFPV